MSLGRFLRATVVLVSVTLATEVYAEQLCFRTSDCGEVEFCKPVSGSAMGICKVVWDLGEQRRALDTENFSKGSTIGNSAFGHEFDNENKNDNDLGGQDE